MTKSTPLPRIDWRLVPNTSRHQQMVIVDLLARLHPRAGVNVIIPLEGGPDAIEFQPQEDHLLARTIQPILQTEVLDKGVRTHAPIPYDVTIEMTLEHSLEIPSQRRTLRQRKLYRGPISPFDHALMFTAFEGRVETFEKSPSLRQFNAAAGLRSFSNLGYDAHTLGWEDLAEQDPDWPDGGSPLPAGKGHRVDRIVFGRTPTLGSQCLPFEDLKPGLECLLLGPTPQE